MPAIIAIQNDEPTGWITAPDIETLFNLLSGTDYRNDSELMNQMYQLRDSVGFGINDAPKRELVPGVWLLLD